MAMYKKSFPRDAKNASYFWHDLTLLKHMLECIWHVYTHSICSNL